MQLRATTAGAALAATLIPTLIPSLSSSVARADDRVDLTTTYFQEQRQGEQGGLRVIHPQLDLGVDLGEHVSLGAGYSADVVSGATAAVYAVDAVSTATPFDDTRHEGQLSLGFGGRRSGIVFTVGTGVERDYASLTAGASGNIDLPGKNTNLALSYTHNFDQVCDRDNGDRDILERQALSGADPCDKERGVFGVDHVENQMLVTTWRDLSIDTVQATVTQNLTPTLNLQASVFGQVLNGFQANPYRRVRVGSNEPQESVPDVRGRLALTVRANQYLRPLRSAVHVSLRGYSDTWGVNSVTGELGYSQYIGPVLLARFRARYYQQSAATFFKDAFFYQTESTAGAYFTGDRELSPVRNILVGGKLSLLRGGDGEPVWGVFDRLQLNVKGDLLFLDQLPADDPAANLAGIDGQFLTSDQLFDVFVLQLGLLLAY